MRCTRQTITNGNRSLLFDKLYEIVQDESTANELYSYLDIHNSSNTVFKDIFLNKEGNNYIDEVYTNEESRVDENNEVKLFFNSKLNKYYYKDKYGEPVFYPSKQGLDKFFTNNEIKTFAKTLAFKYFQANFQFNNDSFELERTEYTKLKDFISDFIEFKISELEKSNDFNHNITSYSLQESKEHLEEWFNETVDVFNTLNLDLAEENVEIEQQAEDIRGEIVRVESFLKSAKSNVNRNIKLFLSLLPGGEINEFNEFNFVKFDDVWNTLNKSLWGIVAVEKDATLEDEFDLYLEKIQSIAKRKPYLNVLVARLRNVDDIFKNQFVNAFRLTKNNFLTSEFSKENDIITHKVLNISDITALSNNLLNQWLFNYDQKNHNKITLDAIKNELSRNLLSLNQNAKRIKVEEDLKVHIDNLVKSLNRLGLTFNPDRNSINYYLDNLSDNNNVENRLQTLIKTFENSIRSIDNFEQSDNIFKDQSIFKDLAKAEAFFLKDGSDASIFSLGKSKWVYSLPSYLENKINQWKKDPSLLLKHYNSSPFYKGSRWMEYLLALDIEEGTLRTNESLKRLADIEVGIFNSIQQEGDSINGDDNQSISYVDSLADYMNKLLAVTKGAKTWHKTALAADKSTEYQLHMGTIKNIMTNAVYINGRIVISDEALEVLYNYFKSEYNTVAYEYDYIELNKNNPSKLYENYHNGEKNALKIALFPSLSFENIHKTKLPFTLYDIKGKPLYKDLDQIKDKVKEHLSNITSRNIENTFKHLVDNGLFGYNEAGVRTNMSIDKDIFNSYLKNEQGNTNKALLKIAGDLFLNSVISQVEYSKMFTGNTAYYKNMVDYKKRVPETYTDGQYMRLLPGEEFFNIAVTESIEIPIFYYEQFEKMVGKEIADKYNKDKKGKKGAINAADAQAWITPQRWEFIMKRLGKWSKTHAEVYRKMNSDKNEVFTEKELKLVGQPLKGVYFDIKDGVPTFLKYSQAVLWKPLIKGTELETIYNSMTKGEYQNQIHELITKDGIKVGATTPVNIHTKDGALQSKFKFNKIELNNNAWKLQQDLPVKGLKKTDLSSQIQKIIFQGLVYNQNETFFIDNKEIKGSDLIVELHNLMSDLSNKGLKKIFKKFGINETTFEIENEEELYSSLIEQLKKRKDVPYNFIKALEAGISPYGIPGSNEMFQNVFSSLINDNTIKIKTNGGGFIQMSDFGLSKNDAVEQKVIFTPWMNTNKLPAPTQYVDENGKKRIRPGGIFLSGTIISKYVPDFRSKNSEELFGKLNPETNKYEGGIIDQDILRNIVGYRIPNQGLPSNDAFEILGILPDAVGDTVIAYTGITVKTGSDFDIDKMYLMIPSFKPIRNNIVKLLKETGLTNKIATQILENEGLSTLGDTNPIESLYEYLTGLNEFNFNLQPELLALIDKIQDTLEKEPVIKLEYIYPKVDEEGNELNLSLQSEAVIQNKLIKAFKAVLTNENTIKDIMNPLDIDYISNDIKNMFPEEQRDDMMNFDAISDLSLKFEFMLGKAGLGQNVNSLVDAVRGSMADIYLNVPNLGRGTKDTNIVFDREYSESLTEQEMKDYVEAYNKNVQDVDKYISLKDVKKHKEIKLFDAMMALVNAFVDIAKDYPYIVRGNWVTQTNNIGFFMLRAGIHPYYVNAFMGQPILKEYVRFISNMESKIIDNSGNILNKFKISKLQDAFIDKDPNSSSFNQSKKVTINNFTYEHKMLIDMSFDINDVTSLVKLLEKDKIKEYEINKTKLVNSIKSKLSSKFKVPASDVEIDLLVQDYINQFNILFEIKYDKTIKDISLKDLKNNIFESDIETQISVLTEFEKFKEYSKDLGDSTNSAKVDVNGKGKNITSLFIQHNLMEKVLNETNPEGLINGKSKMTFEGNNTFLNTYYNNSINIPFKIMQKNPKYFLTAGDKTFNTFNQISKFIYGEELLNDKLGNKLEKAYYSYVLSNFEPLKVSKEENAKLLNDLPSEFKEILKKYPDNLLLQKLYVAKGNLNNQDTYYISMSDGKLSSVDKNDVTDAWVDLLETEPKFAEDLIKYSYITSGFNNTVGQFHQYIPYIWFNKNRFNSYLKTLNENSQDKQQLDIAFIEQFFKNNSEDKTIVKRIFPRQMELLSLSDAFRTGFKTTDTNLGYIVKKVNKGEFNEPSTTTYYKLLGFVNEEAIYVKTNMLGAKDKKGTRIMEYEYNNSNLSSNLNVNQENLNINMDLFEKLNQEITSSPFEEIVPKATPVTETIESQTEVVKDTLYEKIEQQWLKAGYTLEDWNNMTQEQRNYIIKNCL